MNAECKNDVDYIHRHFYEQAIAKIADCAWAGHGHELHISGENINDTVNRVLPGADWAIVNDVAQIRFYYPVRFSEKRICKIAYITGDVYWNPPVAASRYNRGNWDVFLMGQTRLDTYIPSSTNRIPQKADPDFYFKHLNAPIFHSAHSINPEWYKPLDREKEYDVCFLGAHSQYYPLRVPIWNQLPRLAKRNKWRVLVRGSPPGTSYLRKIDVLLKEGYIVGKKYAETLALTKIFIFSSGGSKLAVKKYYEGMASGACVLADTPMCAEELHFEPGVNFVEINKKNWKDKLKYYLKHDEEREEIARRGYETAMKYHTNDVRARQLVDFLEEHR